MLALQEALEIIQNAEVWDHEDDLCDCTFQRIGYWMNPYVGETLEVRMCCIWADIYKQYPQFVRVTKTEPAEWNGETEMPKALWVRQLANHLKMDIAEARELNLPTPAGKAITPKPTLWMNSPWGYVEMVLG